RDRIEAHRVQAADFMDERFCRMWELYLSMSECAFLQGASNVFQIQLGRERDVVPLTRDYIAIEEARIAAREGEFLDRVIASAKQALEE
ncbi:MAG: SAM-dependent methyltransferase, partial [Hoeflea sp.]